MRRLSLVLLLSTASPVLAQEAQEAPAAPAAPAEPAPKAAEPAPAAESAPATQAPAPADKPARRSRAPQPDTAAQAPAPAVQAPAAPAPAPDASSKALTATEIQEGVRDEARVLLSSLLNGDVRGIAPSLTYPFQLEERRFDTPESLVMTWVKQLRQKRTDLISLYDIEVLSYADLEKKYGKPPARLGAIVPRGGVDVYAAVANLSGRGTIILYRYTREGWSAFAFTD
jgi:hypothetical protein